MSIQVHSYGDVDRPEMLSFVPEEARLILDVGCNRGGFGRLLKLDRPNVEVWGIEPIDDAAKVAATRLDRVITGFYPDDVEDSAVFDCIVFNDVLEHLIDPWSALASAAKHLSAKGSVVASIPNVRDLRVTWPLFVSGKWTYTDEGLLDRTHLRFFTRLSIRDMFERSGYLIERLVPINRALSAKLPHWDKAMGKILGHWLDDLRTPQYAVLAKPAA
jgi:2-polyprenyl-3-methyl-5-hydroxy-6-metoxy-1,4-benzoquinol methylase